MEEYLRQVVEEEFDKELIRQSISIAQGMKSPAATQMVVEGLLDFFVEKELRKIKA